MSLKHILKNKETKKLSQFIKGEINGKKYYDTY